jgi:succinate dehydrogenase/fumarate reductase flavoprotein subunit
MLLFCKLSFCKKIAKKMTKRGVYKMAEKANKRAAEKRMEKIAEPAREIDVLMDADVVVVGGGPAGIAASVGAARTGAKTVVVEQYGCLGGLISISSMEPPGWWREERTTMPGGVVEDLDQKMIARGAVQKTFFKPSTSIAYDTEMFKHVADEYVQENGVIPVLHCLGAAPVMEGNAIAGVITESKSGRLAIRAKRVVDCTGDADMAYRAGAECVMAEERTGNLGVGELLGGTLVYGLTDIDVEAIEAEADADPAQRHPVMHKKMYHGIEKARAAGEKMPPYTNKSYLYNRTTRNELPALNHCWYPVDGTDVMSLTRAEIESRKSIVEIIPIFRKYEKGMENAKLRNFAMSIGVRETRRIVGEYRMAFKDVFDEKKFPDAIGIYPVCMDGAEGVMPAFTEAYFQVPYRITVPLKIENLLVAGRCCSSLRRATTITRQVDFAMVTGQAAGAASALSIRQDVPPRKVDIRQLQQELVKQRVRLD